MNTAVIAMLRGINLASHHRVKMEGLRAVYEQLGFTRVSTYIQSGNIVFSATTKQLRGAVERIEAAFAAEFGFAAPTVLRTASEMRDVVAATPFAGRDLNPAKIVVSFLSAPVPADAVASALTGYAGPEEVVPRGREVYIYFPDGMGRTKLPLARMDKALVGAATARNWNTVQRLLEMAERLESS